MFSIFDNIVPGMGLTTADEDLFEFCFNQVTATEISVYVGKGNSN